MTVIKPYCHQCALYRLAMRKMNWLHIKVFTIDSMQGRQNKCILFDIVLSCNRRGGLGFVHEASRLNVGLSRPEEMEVFICDTKALETHPDYQDKLSKLDEDEFRRREAARQDLAKYLRRTLNYFVTKKVVVIIPASNLGQIPHLDWAPVRDYENKYINITCNNCREKGHKSMQCPQTQQQK
ncbi:MAG: hypothetical protein Q9181_004141 [Wetmoreana brouardii]